MKTFICIFFMAAVVVAEPPRYIFKNQRSQNQESEPTTARTDDAPYAPAGFRPAKEFNLPTRQVPQPSNSYGVPDNTYGTPTFVQPQTEYGVPKDTTEDNNEEEKDSNEVQKENLEEAPKEETEVVNTQGVYYVLLPNYQLQRIQYQTANDVRNMAYTARLQYKDEDRAPIYVYTSVPQYPSAAYVQLI